MKRSRRAAWRRGCGVGLALAWCAASAGAGSEEVPCDPIDAPTHYAQLAPSEEPGPRGAPARSQTSLGDGPIITLPIGAPVPTAQDVRGEALLLLPKRSDGTLPSGYRFADGVHIADSYWSPVLCSTVTRLVGRADLKIEQYVLNLPDSAALVPHHAYSTAADLVEAAPAPEPVEDPYRELQHGLDRLGVDEAASVSNGRGVHVAVLDSAPDIRHRDLGRVRMRGIFGGPSEDPAMHGSLTTGIIAAVTGNGYGIAGGAPGADVLAVPICAPLGATPRDTCVLYNLLRGIDLAVSEETQVLNLSFVGPPNPLLERAMSRLEDLGTLVVAAAGNEGTDKARYPAAYPSVVGVGSVDADGRIHPTSNRGISAEIWAPGDEVISTVPGDAFAYAGGTSFAAAHVSAALAVLIGSGADPFDARRALFHAAQARAVDARAPAIAPLCDALARLGRPCETDRD